MYNGVPLVERIKRLVEKQISLLETWAEGDAALTPEQLDQLKTLAMISRQLDLDSIGPKELPPHLKEQAEASTEALLARLPSKT